MRLFIGLLFASLFTAAAFAQTNAPAGSPAGSSSGLGAVIAPTGVFSGSIAAWTISGIGPGMPGAAVTGMPYSADQITERVQTLADGTHITQPAQTTKFYRDSQGRSRTERSFPSPPGTLSKGTDAARFIEIFDPVAGVHYILQSQNHTARSMPMPLAPPPPAPASGTSVRANQMIQVLPAPAQLAARSASLPQDQTSRPQSSHESLGSQTIEGVLAEGSRTTVTYPIGSIGNDRPITTTFETWMSPELKTVVLSKNSDPRNGDSTTRLTNISRAEPDPSLFQIPSDYEVVEPQVANPKQ